MNRQVIKSLTILALLGCLTLAYSGLSFAGDISGTVTDGTNPIIGATVQAWNTYPSGSVVKSATTNVNGAYTISGLTDGTYDVRTYANNYYPKVAKSQTAPSSGVDFALQAVPQVTETNLVCDFWSSATKFEGALITDGDVITAKDPQGIICGLIYTAAGNPGLYNIHVYGDEPGGGDEGASPGDTITFYINESEAEVINGTPTWESSGVKQLDLEAFAVQPASITVSPDTATVASGNTQQFTVSGKDADENDVTVAATDVTWEVIGGIGTITPNGLFTAITPGTGTIKATLKSNTAIFDETGTITVTAGPAATVVAVAVPNILPADGTSTSVVTATVTDANSNLVTGETVTMALASIGTIGAVTDNGNGTYTATYTAGTTVGTDTVTAAVTSTGASDTVDITLTTGPAANVAVVAVPNILEADGVSTSLVTATVTDTNGNLITDETVTMTLASIGTIGDVTNNQDGTYTATYTAGTTVGTDTVTAEVTSTGASDTVDITLTAGPAATVTVVAVPNTLEADGTSTSEVTATVLMPMAILSPMRR